MARKLLVICGPTATGKTDLALMLAKKFQGEIISADARQVYQGLDIGTGKEVEALRQGRAIKSADGWLVDDIPIHLYDTIDPKQIYSAANYALEARNRVSIIWQANKLPILVGGTGFYLQAVIDGIASSGIAGDVMLRKTLNVLPLTDLQKKLQQFDPATFASLNNSDKNNPRRLVRKIELAMHTVQKQNEVGTALDADILWLGLTMARNVLQERIKSRIRKMFTLGLLDEVTSVANGRLSFDDPGLKTIGYAEFKPYFERKQTLAQVEDAIIVHTNQYSKRQLTWFKRNNRIHWYDPTSLDWRQKLVKTVDSWYYMA